MTSAVVVTNKSEKPKRDWFAWAKRGPKFDGVRLEGMVLVKDSSAGHKFIIVIRSNGEFIEGWQANFSPESAAIGKWTKEGNRLSLFMPGEGTTVIFEGKRNPQTKAYQGEDYNLQNVKTQHT